VYRKLAILEPLNVFGLIMAYIWELRPRHPNLWMAILGLMLLSQLVRREDAYSLGFRTRHMGDCWRELAPVLAFLALLMLASGTLLHTMRPIGVGTALASWAVYVPWGVFQQYALNGYFLNRFQAVLGRYPLPAAEETTQGREKLHHCLSIIAYEIGAFCEGSQC